MLGRSRDGRRSQRRLGKQVHATTSFFGFPFVTAMGTRHASRLMAGVLVALAGWGLYALFFSSGFYVYSAEVQGNVVLSPAEIFAASGLEGTNIFWVDPDAVARKLTSTLPNVKSAHVATQLPSHVRITVEENAPAMVWRTGDAQWWVDADGIVVPPRAELSDALTIVDTDAQPVRSGQRVAASVLAAVRELRHWLPELSAMEYSHTKGIGFHTQEGWPIFVGDERDMDTKLTILVALRKQLLADGITPQFVDVRFVERPYYQ
jgi:cell division septal protein FtsQ